MSIARPKSATSEAAAGQAAGRRHASLTAKLLITLVLASVLSTALFSVVEIIREWRDMIDIEKSESEGALRSNLDPMALAVWTIDQRALDVVGRSLVLEPSIYRVEVSDDFGQTWVFVRPGAPERADNEFSRPLLRPNSSEQIGTVRVYENYDHVRMVLEDHLFSTVVSEILEVLLLAALLFIIVRVTVTRPLSRLARRVQNLATRPEPIVLDRPFRRYRDEIDAVVDAINESNSERLRLEAERDRRRQYEERTNKLEALGRLAGGVAHDFNNVLSVMTGYTDFLREDLPRESREREFAERLARCNQTAQKLVQQILAFSRNEAVSLRPSSVAAIVADVRPIVRSAVPATTELTYDIADGLPQVCADPNQIAQVLLNLAMNAHDAFEGRPGRVTIRARRGGRDGTDADAMPVIELDPNQDHVRLDVEDQGSGMPTDILTKIFEPFYTTKGIGRGTGLGLSIVYNTVKLHEGGLWVRSAPGRGTTFSILLPIAKETAEHRSAMDGPNTAVVKRRVLVVDDDPAIGDMLKIGLARNGYDVVSRSGAEAAIAAVESEPAFDVVITDQAMPGMAGTELIRRLKRLNPSLRCILSTGFSEDLDAESARAAGADAFVQKPARVSELVGIIESLFRARSR